MSRFCFVGEPPRRQERSLLSLPQSTASVVGVCRSHRWIIARISEVQAAPRTNGREPALQGAAAHGGKIVDIEMRERIETPGKTIGHEKSP